jgi:hypothetical protein
MQRCSLGFLNYHVMCCMSSDGLCDGFGQSKHTLIFKVATLRSGQWVRVRTLIFKRIAWKVKSPTPTRKIWTRGCRHDCGDSPHHEDDFRFLLSLSDFAPVLAKRMDHASTKSFSFRSLVLSLMRCVRLFFVAHFPDHSSLFLLQFYAFVQEMFALRYVVVSLRAASSVQVFDEVLHGLLHHWRPFLFCLLRWPGR